MRNGATVRAAHNARALACQTVVRAAETSVSGRCALSALVRTALTLASDESWSCRPQVLGASAIAWQEESRGDLLLLDPESKVDVPVAVPPLFRFEYVLDFGLAVLRGVGRLADVG